MDAPRRKRDSLYLGRRRRWTLTVSIIKYVIGCHACPRLLLSPTVTMAPQVNLLPQLHGPPPLTQTILPKLPPFDLPALLSAYRLVIVAETEAVQRYRQWSQGQPKAVKDEAANNVLASRVVGFLFPALWNMRHSLGDKPVARLATEVVSAQGDTKIYNLGRKYIDHLICSCVFDSLMSLGLIDMATIVRTTTVPIPPPSNHPSRPSMDQLEDMLTDAIQGSATDHRSARTRVCAPRVLSWPDSDASFY